MPRFLFVALVTLFDEAFERFLAGAWFAIAGFLAVCLVAAMLDGGNSGKIFKQQEKSSALARFSFLNSQKNTFLRTLVVEA